MNKNLRQGVGTQERLVSSLCRPRGDNDELLAEFDMAEIWVCAAVQLEEAEFWGECFP